MRRIPPMMTNATKIVKIIPVTNGGTPKTESRATATELLWVALPVPRQVMAAKKAKSTASHFKPKPFLM